MVAPRLSDMRLDVGKYSLAIYREILDKDMSGSGLDLARMHTQWNEFVTSLPEAARREIGAQVRGLNESHYSLTGRAKRIARRAGLQPHLSLLKAKIAWRGVEGWSRMKYRTILEAASGLDASCPK